VDEPPLNAAIAELTIELDRKPSILAPALQEFLKGGRAATSTCTQAHDRTKELQRRIDAVADAAARLTRGPIDRGRRRP
jgi:hypothetical protein